MQSVDEINAVLTPETGWKVRIGFAEHDQSEHLVLYAVDESTQEETVLTHLPRETEAGMICAFGGACRHYLLLGQKAGSIIGELQLDKAPTDTERAYVLEALISYAKACGLTDLQRAARAARPSAHPFRPPEAWRKRYLDHFSVCADVDCGVDPDEGPRYCLEYWQGLTDAERQQRLAEPWLGDDDGQKDAEALNAA